MSEWGRRLAPKANCYRVLLRARYFPLLDEPKLWWPVIAADTPEEAEARAIALYSGHDAIGAAVRKGDDVTWDETGIAGGLPIRGDVTVIEVALAHPTHFHDHAAAVSHTRRLR